MIKEVVDARKKSCQHFVRMKSNVLFFHRIPLRSSSTNLCILIKQILKKQIFWTVVFFFFESVWKMRSFMISLFDIRWFSKIFVSNTHSWLIHGLIQLKFDVILSNAFIYTGVFSSVFFVMLLLLFGVCGHVFNGIGFGSL